MIDQVKGTGISVWDSLKQKIGDAIVRRADRQLSDEFFNPNIPDLHTALVKESVDSPLLLTQDMNKSRDMCKTPENVHQKSRREMAGNSLEI